jgi:hypothetical protein
VSVSVTNHRRQMIFDDSMILQPIEADWMSTIAWYSEYPVIESIFTFEAHESSLSHRTSSFPHHFCLGTRDPLSYKFSFQHIGGIPSALVERSSERLTLILYGVYPLSLRVLMRVSTVEINATMSRFSKLLSW